MADVLTRAQRRLNMSRIRGKNTKPEMFLRRALHAIGFRYQLNRRDLPGRPDLVFPRFRAVIFVNGCFWHGHDCSLFKIPETRTDFWMSKIRGNIERDKRVTKALQAEGWRVLTVWECAIRGTGRQASDVLASNIARFLNGQRISLQIGAVGPQRIGLNTVAPERMGRCGHA